MANKAKEEYFSKGIKVKHIPRAIIPHGNVWIPPAFTYLNHYINIVKKIKKGEKYNVLDMGCGSGILSFLFAKYHP